MRPLRHALPLVVAACSGAATTPPLVSPAPPAIAEPTSPAPVAPPAPAPSPPGLRLGTRVRPTHYALDLTIVPTEDSFRGKVAIALDVAEPTSVLWLHGAELTVESAAVAVAGAQIAARPIARTKAIEDAQLLGFALDRPIGPGAAELTIGYRGQIYAKESSGIYRQDERGEAYVFTQFEATDARRAFPCFDEPVFKAPLGLTLHVKREHVAVANAPMVAEADDGPGMKTVRFAETRPLPAYLIALAVGPFDIVDGGKAGKNQVPLRVIVPRGRAAEAAYAVSVTPELVARLESYFGIPYPYDKLDEVAVPHMDGAMENAGLITYGLPILLIAPGEVTALRKRSFADTAAHEIAHHWFGDLVTLSWWDDVWLNESFASWMQGVVVARWQPTWGIALDRVQFRSRTMRSDNLATARRIREPIAGKDDISRAFDGITYGKGSAIIAMIEHWLGPDKFQAAVRSYLAAHAHGVATTADFTAALSAAAGSDVAPVLSSFLDQVGVPNLDVELVCAKGQPPRLVLGQQRYLVTGSTVSAEQTWQLPVCVTYGADQPAGRACTVLAQARGELALPTTQCPRWVNGNADGAGYYHVRYHGALLDRLLDAGRALTLPERVTALVDLSALVESGELPLGKALERVPALAREPDRYLTTATLGFISGLNDRLVPKPLRPNRARFVRKVLGERARALGWASPPGEADDRRLLRPQLLRLATQVGEDPALIATAKKLADAWLTDRHAIDPDLVELALSVAAQFGDRAFFDRLHAAAKTEKERRDRNQLLGAMAGFRDPAIAKDAMALALGDEFDIRESISLVFGASRNDETRELAYAFVKEHLDALLAKLPRDSGAAFISLGGGFCDEAHRADAESFWKDRAAKLAGGPHSLALMNESVELCLARVRADGPGAAAFLAKW